MQQMCLLRFSVHLFSTYFVGQVRNLQNISIKPQDLDPLQHKADCFGSLAGDSKDTISFEVVTMWRFSFVGSR